MEERVAGEGRRGPLTVSLTVGGLTRSVHWHHVMPHQ